MSGIISDAIGRIVPTCRYGHGELKIMLNPSGEPGFMSPAAETIVAVISGSIATASPSAYVYAIYKCAKCSYLEFHDIFPSDS